MHIPGSTHGLRTANLVMDIAPYGCAAHAVIDDTTYDVTVTFVQVQSGTILLFPMDAPALSAHMHVLQTMVETHGYPSSARAALERSCYAR